VRFQCSAFFGTALFDSWQSACKILAESHMAPGGNVKKIQSLSFLAIMAVAVGMISWGSALHAQDTTPSTTDRQAQQPSSTPDTTPSQQTPSSQSPDATTPPSQSPDSSQTPDTTTPNSRMPQSGSSPSGAASAAGASDTQTFSGTVTKQGDKYVLKDDSGHTYDIDHQDEVKKFDGKKVRVQGTLDPSGNKILVK
jgi:cytoskeletal protein RodZ